MGKLPTYPEIVISPEANIRVYRWAVRKKVEKRINIREEKIERLERNKRMLLSHNETTGFIIVGKDQNNYRI